MLGAGACVSGGCGPAGESSMRNHLASRPAGALDAWVAGEMVNLTDRTQRQVDLDVYDPSAGQVSLLAGANETVSFQVVLEGGKQGADGVNVSWSEFSTGEAKISKIPASSIRAYRMLAIPVSKYPDWYLRLADGPAEPTGVYDPLVPIDASAAPAPALDVKPGRRLALWVDVAVPRSALPGTYTAAFNLASPDGRKWSARLSMEVLAFVLPDERAIPAVGGFGHRQLMRALLARDSKPFDPVYLDRDNPMVRRGLVLIRDLMRMAHEHRVDLFDTDIHPLLKRTGVGEVHLDWKDYDAIVQPYLDGSAFDDHIGVPAWPMPFSQDWPVPDNLGGVGSEGYSSAVTQLLTEARKHLGGAGNAGNVGNVGKNIFLWPARNLQAPEGYATHMALAELARKAVADVPILSQLPAQAPPGSDWAVPKGFRETADIFAPRGEMFDPNLSAAAAKSLQQAPGGTGHPLAGVWLASGRPPYLPSLGLIAKPADARAMPWFAMKYGCTGLLLPDVLHWSGDPFAPVAEAETRLFYPGSVAGLEAPLPSVRLKRLRRGLQDIAYLWILHRRQRQGVAQTVTNALVRYGGLAATGDNYLDCRLDGWVADGATWELARRVLAEEVQAAVTPEKALRLAGLAHQLAWSRLNEQTESLQVEQVRSSVEPAPGSTRVPPEKVRMTVLLDLFNCHNIEASIQAVPANLPDGWKLLSGQAPAITLAPYAMGVIRIAAEGPPGPLPIAANARAPLTVTLTSNVEKPMQVEAQVPLLLAGQTRRPLTIDGDLRDWPIRTGNAAKDFRLIGRRGHIGAGLAGRQTMAFVLRDEKNLYLAFRCEEPSPSGMVHRPTNRVTYEQLIACGEDLVEVLLDPGGKASGLSDLYHLVIKPNGVHICERGVACKPALGAVGAWPASASVAIGSQDAAWTAEVAIPLASLGPDGQSAFWRVNFMRYSPQGDECSSWSGAQRYFYDPRNLGTMFVGSYVDSNP